MKGEKILEQLDIVRKLCEERGISIAQLEKILGYGNGSIAKSKTLRSDRVVDIASYFGVSTDYILTGKNGTLERVQLENEPCIIKVLGRVAAGFPIEASEDVIGEEMITSKMAESGEYFGLRISGNSMEPEIHHGSIVIVRQQDDVENGDIAIVLINGGEATCKKVEKFDNGIMLVPFNKEYPEKFYTNEEIENLPVRILGKVVEQRKKY